jgi:hypothetical protein
MVNNTNYKAPYYVFLPSFRYFTNVIDKEVHFSYTSHCMRIILVRLYIYEKYL